MNIFGWIIKAVLMNALVPIMPESSLAMFGKLQYPYPVVVIY